MQLIQLFYAKFIVTHLLLSYIQVGQLAATSQCSGTFLSPVSSGHHYTIEHSWDSSWFGDRLVKLAVPDCLRKSSWQASAGGAITFNLTYVLEDLPHDGYVIVSGNITGHGSIYVSDEHQSTTQPNFVFYASRSRSKLTVLYINDDWQPGEGPFVDVFYAAETHSYCAEPWRKCPVTVNHEYICLPKEWGCNGREECDGAIDESDCNSCCTQLDYGSQCMAPDNCMCVQYSSTSYRSKQSIRGCNGKSETVRLNNEKRSDLQSLPFWPMLIPYNITFIWTQATLPAAASIAITFTTIVVSQGDTVRLRVGIVLYDLSDMTSGAQKTVSLEGVDEAPMLNIVMMSPSSVYNFSYAFVAGGSFGAAPQDTIYVKSCQYGKLYFRKDQRCDGLLDCPNGKDELGCGSLHDGVCAKNEIMCPLNGNTPSCFTMKQRCDGLQDCDYGYDEEGCDSTLCGTHNGTFLCFNLLCIPETGICNKSRDCSDGGDEQNCDVTSLNVITASVIGSLSCALMIVIAVGCSYRHHYQRMYDSSHQRSRYESPMTLITNELMRRAAPPPYAEAMQRSRPFEEVRSEYHAALELRQREEAARDSQADLEEQMSVASASGMLDAEEGHLLDLEDNTGRHNRNKPPEASLSGDDQTRNASMTLEPKSDDETAGSSSSPASVTSATQISLPHSDRQDSRRVSIDSDVSILSQDSEDVALLSLQ
ncbi:low-density lipoprotein receptor-related protein 3-like [Watersipora subatra]|uniref:low-density lipoprotein receptor-related protein 3-like n=1 Tax=Watersipora subatra TaxID=2589382 RepID=UPI00355B7E27